MFGAALDNRDTPHPDSYDKLVAMRAETVGMLWIPGALHRRPVYDAIEARLTAPEYILRVGPGRITVEELILWCNDAVAQVPPQAVGRTKLRLLNEVNLPEEGGWTPEEYAQLLVDFARLRGSNLAQFPVMCAPVSLGIPGAIEWWRRFNDLAPPYDEAAVNIYADNVYLAPELVVPGKRMCVTEISTLAFGGVDRAQWTFDRLVSLYELGFGSVQQFIVGGQSNGAWPEAYIMSMDECRFLADDLRRFP